MLRIFTSSRYLVDRKRIRILVEKTLSTFQLDPTLSVTIVFVGKNKMRSIASTYKHEDVALPVLAFPYKNDADMEEPLFGEIFLCYPQIVLLAVERNKRLDVLIDELIIHGLTNLLK
ncbi:MAG: rRNA maturation RNase YbeY [Candidatus Roizmanbacteria bacterium]|nr:rRNA maturation RNase YbeY [Candidatus Roizmanbacteria bacterium]